MCTLYNSGYALINSVSHITVMMIMKDFPISHLVTGDIPIIYAFFDLSVVVN